MIWRWKNANNARLLQVSWQKRANTIHPFLDVSLPFSLFGSIAPPLSATPSSPFVPQALTAGWWAGRGGPTETGYSDLSASGGRAWRGSAYSRGVIQRVTRSRNSRTSCKSVRPRSHNPPSCDGACQYCLPHYLNPPPARAALKTTSN